MAKYEALKTITLPSQRSFLPSVHSHNQLVHMDDPALSVLCDFSFTSPKTIRGGESIDNALNEMKIHGVHLLLVKGSNNSIAGVIGSEDILGELPITLIQEKRIKRSQVLVKMLMTPISSIAAFELKTLERAKVGNIVTTLKNLHTHYALVVHKNGNETEKVLCGIFTTSQISHQLHQNIADFPVKAKTLSELQKRDIK